MSPLILKQQAENIFHTFIPTQTDTLTHIHTYTHTHTHTIWGTGYLKQKLLQFVLTLKNNLQFTAVKYLFDGLLHAHTHTQTHTHTHIYIYIYIYMHIYIYIFIYIYTYIYIGFRKKITIRFTTINFTIFRSSGKLLLYSLQDIISDKFNRLIYNYFIRICCHGGIQPLIPIFCLTVLQGFHKWQLTLFQ